MTIRKTTMLLCLATAMISGASTPAISKESAPIDRSACKEYLDEMWVRIVRTWGIADNRSSDFLATSSFELDANGNVSNIAIEQKSVSFAVNERLRKTFQACAPFRLSPLKKTTLHVNCKVQARQGALSLELRIPEFASANTDDVATVADADLIKGLIDTLRTSKGQQKQDALEELKTLGVKAQPALPAILEAIRDNDSSTIYRAFEALQAMGAAAKDALPEMIKYMKGSDDRLREQSVIVIATMGPTAEEAVPLLLEALDDSDSTVKHGAAKALRGMGSAVSQKAVATLMQSSFHEYITFVPEIIAEFGAEAVPALIKGTEDADRHVVHHSVEALQKMGDAAAPAVPALIKLIDLKVGGEAQEKAIETLGKLGALGKAAVPCLTVTIRSGGEDYRWRSIEALGSIGPDAREAIPVLNQYVNGADPDLRRRAKEAIRKIEAAQ